MFEIINETASYIKSQTTFRPHVAIVLGSGLGDLVNQIESAQSIPYESIPHFPESTVEGHGGRLIFGYLGGKEVVALQGRFHYYEGYTMELVTFPIRVMKAIGVDTLFLSNAAGGIHPSMKVGDLMLIEDHINLFPDNPLRGRNDNRLGPRFPDMSDLYSIDLIRRAEQIAQNEGLELHRGVYVGVQGPSYETKAELRYFRMIGGDAVGMSTVTEAIVARHAAMRVFALSVITNVFVDPPVAKVTHEEVLRASALAQPRMCRLFHELIRTL